MRRLLITAALVLALATALRAVVISEAAVGAMALFLEPNPWPETNIGECVAGREGVIVLLSLPTSKDGHNASICICAGPNDGQQAPQWYEIPLPIESFVGNGGSGKCFATAVVQ